MEEHGSVCHVDGTLCWGKATLGTVGRRGLANRGSDCPVDDG
jgi:hypothetical protein